MSDFIHKLFSSYKERTDGDTLTGELNRIWYDSKTNTFRIQLDNTPGGTVISGGGGGNYTLPVATSTVLGGVKIGANISINSGVISVAAPFSGSYTDLTNKPTIPSLTGYATLTGEETLTNKTLTSPTITDGVFQDTFSIGNQVFYEHGTHGFSVNENYDIVGEGNFTGYHYTSGAGRDGVAFTLARTGQFTTGFGIHGTSSANEYVIGSETAKTDFVFKKSIGMPFDVSGGTDLFRISNDGSVTFSDATVQTTAWTGTFTTATIINGSNQLRISSVPSTLNGASGDTVGDIAFDSNYIYYCINPFTASTFVFHSITTSGLSYPYLMYYATDPNPTTPIDWTGWTVTGPNGYSGTITGTSVNTGGSGWQIPVSPSILQQTGDYTFISPGGQIWTKTPWQTEIIPGTDAATTTQGGNQVIWTASTSTIVAAKVVVRGQLDYTSHAAMWTVNMVKAGDGFNYNVTDTIVSTSSYSTSDPTVGIDGSGRFYIEKIDGNDCAYTFSVTEFGTTY